MTDVAYAAGNKRHALKERKDDLYQSPPEAVLALLKAEKLPVTLWEPACGPGAIVRVLRANGHQVYATDLVDYSSPHQDESGWDFLMERQLPIGVQGIVSNPPFKNAAIFIKRAVELCPLVCMLLRLNFIEAGNMDDEAGRARRELLDGGKLARMYVFKNRLPMMHRDGWAGNRTRNPTAFAWFVWDWSHRGPVQLQRIAWEAACSD